MFLHRRDPVDHAIIHAFAVVAAGIGGGLARLPGPDRTMLTSVQAAMVMALAERHGSPTSLSGAAELALTLGAAMAGMRLARGIRSVPYVGPAANALTAAAMTEAVGWAAVAWFRRVGE